ncbi:sarcosine oxidase subunit gamma family protein [Streptomyces sp. NPDC020298]|uniref:sarcosine oxidase subunit gamma family protein n=1 Tax=unclassified Streptomyces TaxID=2593676 RepID=UPI0033F2BF8D
MADTAPTTRQHSPLAQAADRLAAATRSSGGAVRLAGLPFLTQVNVRLDAKSPAADAMGLALGLQLPPQPDTVVRAGNRTVLWLGPHEWLVAGPSGIERDLEGRIRAAAGDEPVSVTDVCAQTTPARTQVVLVAREETRAGFRVLVRSSFAGYLADW